MEDSYWDMFWETRLHGLENLGKQAAILAASRLIRQLARQNNSPIRLLELGCGEGQVIGSLLDAHNQVCDLTNSLAVDYNPQSINQFRKDFPGFRIMRADFTNPTFQKNLGEYEIVLLVNVLHEVFSNEYSQDLGEIDVPDGKQAVEQVLRNIAKCLVPGGWLVLFDGLEPEEISNDLVQLHFIGPQARADFDTFARQYRPFKIQYSELKSGLDILISYRDFTRYITKSIFLGKHLWSTEQLESYQYFTEMEFRETISRVGLRVCELETLTMNEEKWRNVVQIVTPGIDFPDEHIMILAQSAIE